MGPLLSSVGHWESAPKGNLFASLGSLSHHTNEQELCPGQWSLWGSHTLGRGYWGLPQGPHGYQVGGYPKGPAATESVTERGQGIVGCDPVWKRQRLPMTEINERSPTMQSYQGGQD